MTAARSRSPRAAASRRHVGQMLYLFPAILLCVSGARADDGPGAGVADMARVRAYEQARIQVIERVRPAVTCLFNRGSRAGGGSGVIIDPEGYGLTNFHVVAGMLEERVGDAGMSDGRIYEMDVLGIDPTGDMAMFRAHGKAPFPCVELGDSDELKVGDYTLAMGNPFLLAEDYASTVTLGIVSGVRRYQAGAGEEGRALRYTDCIQVDTSINPGNSGGPLFDMNAKLVGINGRVSIEERGRVNVGVGYAISINQIRRFIPMWRAGLATKHATAGFTVSDRRGEIVVDQILDDSTAYKAGLRLGDRIESFAGRKIASANQFGSYLGVFPAHWPVEVIVLRRDGAQTIRFRLEDLPFPADKNDGALMGAKNPFAETNATRAANRRAVKRSLKRFQLAMGGNDFCGQIASMSFHGKRVVADRPEESQTVNVEESKDAAAAPSTTLTPVDQERAVRWMLMKSSRDDLSRKTRITGVDEVTRRLAVVVEFKSEDGLKIKLGFDDDTGDLLRVEFKDGFSGKRVRYEYGDFRREGRSRVPHGRSLYLNDELHAIEQFDEVTIK